MEESEKIGQPKKHRRNTSGLRPPWKPGQCGNPAGHGPGAPKRSLSFTNLCREFAAEIDPDDPTRTNLDRLRAALWELAESGDTRAAQLILDRLDPATQRHQVEHSTPDESNAMVKRMLAVTTIPLPTLPGNGANGNGH